MTPKGCLSHTVGRVGKGLLLLPQEDTVERESRDGKQEESGETSEGGNKVGPALTQGNTG